MSAKSVTAGQLLAGEPSARQVVKELSCTSEFNQQVGLGCLLVLGVLLDSVGVGSPPRGRGAGKVRGQAIKRWESRDGLPSLQRAIRAVLLGEHAPTSDDERPGEVLAALCCA